MRWAMPYPCCRPSVSSVFILQGTLDLMVLKTLGDAISVLPAERVQRLQYHQVESSLQDVRFGLAHFLFINRSVANSPVDCQEERRVEGIGPGVFGDFGSRLIYTLNRRETPAHDFTSLRDRCRLCRLHRRRSP